MVVVLCTLFQSVVVSTVGLCYSFNGHELMSIYLSYWS
jgi:hypothetical protein